MTREILEAKLQTIQYAAIATPFLIMGIYFLYVFCIEPWFKK